MDSNSLIIIFFTALFGLSCAIILRWFFLRLRKPHQHFQNHDPDYNQNLSETMPPPQGQADGKFAQREAEWQIRWQERERQIERQVELQRSEQERFYLEQTSQYQKRIAQLEAEQLKLQAEKVRLETILEQQSNLQNQLLEQSKLSWEELSNKQQHEHTQHILQNLQPLQQQLQYFQQQLAQQHQDGIKNSAQLEQYIKHLQDDTHKLSNEAQNLAEALKGDQKRQGAWGEMLLARTLEQCGLREGVEYQLQKSFTSSDGNVFRPDAIVQFPGQRYIIIDSKVSLKAYEAYLASADSQEQELHWKKHCSSMAKHIKELSSKEYQNLLGIQQSPDFVLLFCPIEGALAETLRQDSSLFEEGFQRHVILVSPSLLFVVLRIIEQLWRYEKQRRNVAQVYAQAGKIFDKLVPFCNDMLKVEQQVNTLHKNIEQATHRLSNGQQSLLRQVQKLQNLGADTSKELPSSLLENSLETMPSSPSQTVNVSEAVRKSEEPMLTASDTSAAKQSAREFIDATA